MGFSLKSIGRGLKKVASIANPLFGAAYDTIGGKSASDVAHNYVSNNINGAKIAGAAAALPAAGAGAAGAGGGLALSSLGSLGGVGGALKKAGAFALDNPDLILGGLSAIEGHDAARKADRFRGKSLAAVEQAYADAAPLRKAGLAGLTTDQRPDLSAAFASSNPFARPLRKVPL